MIQDFLLPLDSPWHPSQRLSPKVRMPGERILKVTKKSGNRGRCRKLSLWNWFLVRQLTCQTSPRFLGYDFLSLFFSSYWRVLWSFKIIIISPPIKMTMKKRERKSCNPFPCHLILSSNYERIKLYDRKCLGVTGLEIFYLSDASKWSTIKEKIIWMQRSDR